MLFVGYKIFNCLSNDVDLYYKRNLVFLFFLCFMQVNYVWHIARNGVMHFTCVIYQWKTVLLHVRVVSLLINFVLCQYFTLPGEWIIMFCFVVVPLSLCLSAQPHQCHHLLGEPEKCTGMDLRKWHPGRRDIYSPICNVRFGRWNVIFGFWLF